jgi:uncharacterized protein YaaN involved in tellurite resistance
LDIELDIDKIKKEMELAAAPPEAAPSLRGEQADQLALKVIELDPGSAAARRAITDYVENFGLAGLAASASKNHLMGVTIDKLVETGQGGGPVSRSLVDLSREIANLDPSNIDFNAKGILALILNPIKRYFAKYKKAETVIQDVIESLKKGKNSLINDNITINIEKEELKNIYYTLDADIKKGAELDKKISEYAEKIKASADESGAEKARFIEGEVLLPLSQRIMDLRQLLVVNQQARLSMEVILRNNQELCRAVDRAVNVTVSALRTAVMVAGALYNQRITLKKIQAVNETTGHLIAGAAKMLKTQGAEIGRGSMEATISVETLKKAFGEAISAMEDIGRYRREALPKIRETIERFRELAETGDKAMSALERGEF